MDDKKRILFVDDDENVLNGLRRMLRKISQNWDVDFFNSAKQALTAMGKRDYDVIVSDLRMNEMNGVELLEIVTKRFPDVTRFILTGYTEQPLYGKALLCAHQVIPKPCSSEQLILHLSRAFSIRKRIRSRKVSSVLPSLKSLPAMPKVYQQVIDEIGNPQGSCRRVGQMIAKDIGMSAKILQVVNSDFYGPASKIADPVRATVFLGLKAIKALLLMDGVFSRLPEKKVEKFCVSGLQEHCLRVGSLAKSICKAQNFDERDQDVAMVAGILHDTGKMVLISEFPDEFAEVIQTSRSTGKPVYEVERDLLHLTHAELGGCLLNLWSLPNDIIEAATFHHEPQQCHGEKFSVVSAVYAADAIDHRLCSSLGDGVARSIDTDYLESLGVAEDLEMWNQLHIPTKECQEIYA